MSEQLEVTKSVVIEARRERVWPFLSDPEQFANWWGEGSTIRAEVGADVQVVYPGGSKALGTVTEVDAPNSITFTWGYEGEGKPIAPGASTVQITLDDHEHGTLVTVRHRGFASDDLAAGHDLGWQYHLSQFAQSVTRSVYSGQLEALAKTWFASWGEADDAKHAAMLAEICEADVQYQDLYASITGRGNLQAHMHGAREHVPAGMRTQLAGDIQQVYANALVPWEVRAADGTLAATGRVAFDLSLDGKITRATAYWDPQKAI